MRRTFPLALALLAIALLASSLVLPAKDSAVVAASRFGRPVRLLPPRLAFSPLPLASRLVVPRERGAAVLPAELVILAPSGSPAKVSLSIQVVGSGPLPMEASELRRQGLAGALGSLLQQRLPRATLGRLFLVAEGWARFFPQDAEQKHELLAALGEVFAPLAVRDIQVSVAPELLQAEARGKLSAMARKGGRLVVLGLDALDWQLVDELAAKGTVPNLARLLREAVQAELAVPAPLISPVVWTTLATGQPPQVHGVLDFLEPDPRGGPPHPVSARSRQVPAVWEMLAAAGKACAVIGWWATFPAQAPPGGVVYSDRLTEQLLGLSATTPHLADPPRAQEEALALAVRAKDVTAQDLAPVAQVSPEELATGRGEDWEDPVGGLAKLWAATVTVERLAAKELRAKRDAVFVYLEGTDTVGHLFAPYRSPALPGVDPAKARRFGQVVDRYMAHVDAFLGQVLAQLGPEDSLVVVSDHGFTWGADRPRVPSGAHTATAVWWHRPVGVLLVRSPHVRHPGKRVQLEVLQVAPLLLALGGMPPAAEMPGALPDWVRLPPLPPVNYLALLGRREVQQVELPPEARAEELAKLKALGYLGGEERQGPAPAPRATPAPALDRAEARRLNNLASSLAAAGDRAKAVEVFRQAIAADPTYAAPHYNLALLLRREGKFQEADQEFWLAVDLGIADPELSVVRSALDYREKGELARAEAMFRGGLARFPQSVPLLLNAGVFFGELGKLGEAQQLLAKACQLEPNNPKAHRNLAVALAAAGDTQGAIAELEVTLRLDPNDQAAQRELARLRGGGVQ